jgi:3-(methylthio)propanoyl-CoA dehydrogenase
MPTPYKAPIADMLFLLNHVVGIDHLQRDDLDPPTQEAILSEAAKLAEDELAPLNWSGDQDGAHWDNGSVTMPAGFKNAYHNYCQGGWNSVPFSADYGGQNLPWVMAFPVQEMWQASNMAFGLCPLLNQGAVEALLAHGSDEQKKIYLPKLISGEWTGTMNLTEPQAGSDLSTIRTKAERHGNGVYKIFGQKIYITYGEHDMSQNIIHLVLARLPDAPAGTKGISLFLVPKYLVNMDGSLGARNDVSCVSIEHKLGIHASPTCTMQFGDHGGAIGYLIGQENEGLKYMFTMMNNARLSVGLQGVAIADRATQAALDYARTRVQGKNFSAAEAGTILDHADVKRMILKMKSLTEAMRALAYESALHLDLAHQGHDISQAKVDLYTPLVKSFATDMAVEVASLGVQIHGGMGFIEETGVAQFYRDARILPIYEGTNGIQAADLLFRKVLKDNGKAAKLFMTKAETISMKFQNQSLMVAIDALETSTDLLMETAKDRNLDIAASVSSPYLRLFALTAGGVMMARSALALDKINDEKFKQAKQATIQFYMTHILPEAFGLSVQIRDGMESVALVPSDIL